VVFGGPSVSSPSLAGIVHSAGGQRLNSADELTLLYSGLGSSAFPRHPQRQRGNLSLPSLRSQRFF